MTTKFFRLLVLGLLVATVGCKKVDLYANLPEREINEMIAILLANGIDCSKVAGEEGLWNMTVEESRYGDAVTILSDLGRPRKHRPTIQELFPKTGFTSSPAEQRIRLTYGLAQSLEATITTLPGGVIDASVHLVLPDNQPLTATTVPSRASVIVVHARGAQIENSIPVIQQIVIGAIDGLMADDVSVELVEADESLADIRANSKFSAGTDYVSILSMKIAKDSVIRFYAILGVAGVSTFLLIIILLAKLFRPRPKTSNA